ncbi:MAG: hypothetical protein RJA07_929 [Bacteroidota bacterium]|jgi:hypothetical protein
MEEENEKLNIESLTLEDIGEIVILYIKNNRFSLSCLVFCGVLGWSNFFGLSKLAPWKCWETCALGFTLLYTVYIYAQGWRKKFFKELDGGIGLILGIAFILLLFVNLISANEFINIFNFHLDRPWVMISLLSTTFIFVIVDFLLFKFLFIKQPKISSAYLLSLKYSDIPITLTFTFLTIYSFILKHENKLEQMDAFFGGTIAFQMMLSNIVWTFTDDAFLKEHSKHPKNKIKIDKDK